MGITFVSTLLARLFTRPWRTYRKAPRVGSPHTRALLLSLEDHRDRLWLLEDQVMAYRPALAGRRTVCQLLYARDLIQAVGLALRGGGWDQVPDIHELFPGEDDDLPAGDLFSPLPGLALTAWELRLELIVQDIGQDLYEASRLVKSDRVPEPKTRYPLDAVLHLAEVQLGGVW